MFRVLGSCAIRVPLTGLHIIKGLGGFGVLGARLFRGLGFRGVGVWSLGFGDSGWVFRERLLPSSNSNTLKCLKPGLVDPEAEVPHYEYMEPQT